MPELLPFFGHRPALKEQVHQAFLFACSLHERNSDRIAALLSHFKPTSLAAVLLPTLAALHFDHLRSRETETAVQGQLESLVKTTGYMITAHVLLLAVELLPGAKVKQLVRHLEDLTNGKRSKRIGGIALRPWLSHSKHCLAWKAIRKFT